MPQFDDPHWMPETPEEAHWFCQKLLTFIHQAEDDMEATSREAGENRFHPMRLEKIDSRARSMRRAFPWLDNSQNPCIAA